MTVSLKCYCLPSCSIMFSLQLERNYSMKKSAVCLSSLSRSPLMGTLRTSATVALMPMRAEWSPLLYRSLLLSDSVKTLRCAPGTPSWLSKPLQPLKRKAAPLFLCAICSQFVREILWDLCFGEEKKSIQFYFCPIRGVRETHPSQRPFQSFEKGDSEDRDL